MVKKCGNDCMLILPGQDINPIYRFKIPLIS